MTEHNWRHDCVTIRRHAAAAVAGAALVCFVLLSNRNWVPPACLHDAFSEAAGVLSASSTTQQQQVAAVIGSANHKTGSKQLVCLGKAVQAAVQTNVTLKIISNTTASDTALVAAAGKATPGRPSFLVTYFHSSHECYGVAAESKEAFKCRRPGFPCTADGAPALSLEGCYFSLPTTLPIGVLHFVRDPWDVVTSAYWYHQQQPAPEGWIDVPFSKRVAAMAAEGVPEAALEALGLDLSSGDSYGELLRTLPEDVGIQLEFWRSAPGLYAMARQAQFFERHPGGIQLQYEDLQTGWDAAVTRIASRFYPRYVAQLVKQAQSCDTGNWSKEKLESSNHVTTGKHSEEDKLRLQEALARDADVQGHLCAVCAAMRYGCEAWCGDGKRR